MKVVIPTIPTLLSLSALLSISASIEAKGMIRRNARTEEGLGEPEVSDILNGTPTGKALPYQVGLSIGTAIPNCGGSLIAPRVVLTAAHCYIDPKGNFYDPVLSTVRLNTYDASNVDEPGSAPINLSYAEIGRDIFVHPGFDPVNKKPFSPNDIALVILPFGVGAEEDDNIKYAKRNKDRNVPAADERLYISGWGNTEQSNFGSEILLGTVNNYLPGEECTKMFTGCPECEALFNTKMMCTYTKGTGPCGGDSGGPLVIASQNEIAPATRPPLQVGIVSLAFGDCKTDTLTVYTRVSYYDDWITSTACEAVGELCASSKSGKSSKSGSGKSSKYSKSQLPSSVSAEEDVDNV